MATMVKGKEATTMNDRREVEELKRVVAEMITDPTGRTEDDLGDAAQKVIERIEKLEMENTLMRTALLAAKRVMELRGWNIGYGEGHERHSYLAVEKALTEVGSVAPKERK